MRGGDILLHQRKTSQLFFRVTRGVDQKEIGNRLSLAAATGRRLPEIDDLRDRCAISENCIPGISGFISPAAELLQLLWSTKRPTNLEKRPTNFGGIPS